VSVSGVAPAADSVVLPRSDETPEHQKGAVLSTPQTPRTILVTGATGYVGGRLVPRLLDAGHRVRTTTTDLSREAPWWADRVETVEMDIQDDAQVDQAIAGTDVVFYLVHGMGGEDFVRQDREAAQRVAAAVERHDVGRVVYLSGIVPPVPADDLSEHITSRHEVEQILSATSATVLTLRAAVIMGSGSTSFEIIRQVSERLPIQTIPTWMDSEVQPIAVVDALAALVGAVDADVSTRSYDVGGAERMPYADLLDLYSEVAGLTRPQVSVPLLPTDLVGRLTGLLTDVPAPTVEALVESLHHDMVCAETDFVDDLLPSGYELMDMRAAIERSLADPRVESPADPEHADPMGPMPHDPEWAAGGDADSLLARGIDAVKGLVE